MIEHGRLPEYLDKLKYKEKELETIISDQQKVLLCLRKTREYYQNTFDMDCTFSIKEFPGYMVQESFDSFSSFQTYKDKVLDYIVLANASILQPELEKRFPPVISTVIVSTIWAVWHLSLPQFC